MSTFIVYYLLPPSLEGEGGANVGVRPGVVPREARVAAVY